MYDDCKYVCIEGDYIINIFLFFKVYGMMGWRVGYVRIFLNFLICLIFCVLFFLVYFMVVLLVFEYFVISGCGLFC